MDATVRFWDKIAPKYARSPIADEAAYEKKLAVTQGFMRPEFEVVEFGCGTGSTAIRHAPHVQRITGIDFSRGMLEVARERVEAAGVDNIDFVMGDITTYQMPRESCDMVMAMSLLHLLKHPEAAIGRVSEMLRPGGYFVSSTACLKDMMPIMALVGPVGKALGLLPELSVFSDKQLVGMMERHGFAIRHHWLPKKKAAVFIVAQKAG